MRLLERQPMGADRALLLLRGLRALLVVGALVVAGLAWLHGSPTVLGLALVIGGEELLETSTVIAALRRDPGVTSR